MRGKDVAEISVDDLEAWAQTMEEHHKPDGTGGCTCGFCVWSIPHVLIMSIRDAWPYAVMQQRKRTTDGLTKK